MDGIQNQDFSGLPSLGDEQGLVNYLQNEQMTAQGIQPTEPTKEGTSTSTSSETAKAPVAPVAPTTAATTTPTDASANSQTVTLTQEQLAQIIANAQTARTNISKPAVPQTPAQLAGGYTAQEQTFIQQALARGYSLTDINNTIVKHRNGGVNTAQNNALAQQVAQIQNYLQAQEYKQAQDVFINKLSSFGDKFGLSEQDLVTFGNVALSKGINIAMPNVDLETVFRAVYPEQYRIRMQRMAPTNASQIYGGTSIPESGNRAAASRMEDAYVDSFLKQAMPNQFQMNKK